MSSDVQAPEKKTVEAWASLKATPDWLFAAAKQREGWPIGRELVEEDYDAAVSAAASMPIR